MPFPCPPLAWAHSNITLLTLDVNRFSHGDQLPAGMQLTLNPDFDEKIKHLPYHLLD